MNEHPTLDEIKKAGYIFHHDATRKHHTRKADRFIGEPYKGRFGTGYIVPVGRYRKSSTYEVIEYYVKPKQEN